CWPRPMRRRARSWHALPSWSSRRCAKRNDAGATGARDSDALTLRRAAKTMPPTKSRPISGEMFMRCVVGAALLGGFVVFASSAFAQNYPDRPIRVISPNPPGGANDTIVRIVTARMAPLLGATIVIDNRGGGAGKIGAEVAARAAADGYTLLAGSVSTHSFAPITTPKLAYDPVKDFAPVSLFALVQNVLVVPPNSPAQDVRALIALARA